MGKKAKIIFLVLKNIFRVPKRLFEILMGFQRFGGGKKGVLGGK